MAIMECCPSPLALPAREMTVKEFKTWLMKFDRDHNGKLSQEELKRALASLHEWFAWWKARKAMKEVDTNGDRQLDKEEIDKYVQYAHQHLRTKIATASN